MTPTNPTSDELQEALRWSADRNVSPPHAQVLAAAYRQERAAREKAEAHACRHTHLSSDKKDPDIEMLESQVELWKGRYEVKEKSYEIASHEVQMFCEQASLLTKERNAALAEVSALRSRITELEDEAKHRPAWECAKHRTFGPSYLSCAHCAAADPENKEKP